MSWSDLADLALRGPAKILRQSCDRGWACDGLPGGLEAASKRYIQARTELQSAPVPFSIRGAALMHTTGSKRVIILPCS